MKMKMGEYNSDMNKVGYNSDSYEGGRIYPKGGERGEDCRQITLVLGCLKSKLPCFETNYPGPRLLKIKISTGRCCRGIAFSVESCPWLWIALRCYLHLHL